LTNKSISFRRKQDADEDDLVSEKMKENRMINDRKYLFVFDIYEI